MIVTMFALAAGSELPRCAEQPDSEASASIAAMYEAAQAPGTESETKSRTKAVLKLHKKGLVCTADDHYKAGLLLFQSRDSDALELAHDLALIAAHAHVDRSKWLVTNTFDRWQISLGRPQRFGTQVGRDGGCLYPLDTEFPDANRVGWGAKTMTDTYTAFLKSRGLEGEPATPTTFNNLSLFCRLEAW